MKKGNQKGGLMHFLHPRVVQYFSEVSVSDGENVDCCPCVWKLLGLEQNLFEDIQNYAKTCVDGMCFVKRYKGTNVKDIENQMNYYFKQRGYDLEELIFNTEIVTSTDPEITYKLDEYNTPYITNYEENMDKLRIVGSLFENLKEYYNTIPNNYGIFCGFKYSTREAHCVLFCNYQNQMAIIDPQNPQLSIIGEDLVFQKLLTEGILLFMFFEIKYTSTNDYARTYQQIIVEEDGTKQALEGINLEDYKNIILNISDVNYERFPTSKEYFMNNYGKLAKLATFSLPDDSSLTIEDMNRFWRNTEYTQFLIKDKLRGCSVNVLTYLGIIRTYAEGDAMIELMNEDITRREVIIPGASELFEGKDDHPGALNFSEILALITNSFYYSLEDNQLYLRELSIDFYRMSFEELVDRYNSVDYPQYSAENNFVLPEELGEEYHSNFVEFIDFVNGNLPEKHFCIVKFNRFALLDGDMFYGSLGHTQLFYKQDDKLFTIDPQNPKIFDTSDKLEKDSFGLSEIYREQGYIGASIIVILPVTSFDQNTPSQVEDMNLEVGKKMKSKLIKYEPNTLINKAQELKMEDEMKKIKKVMSEKSAQKSAKKPAKKPAKKTVKKTAKKPTKMEKVKKVKSKKVKRNKQ